MKTSKYTDNILSEITSCADITRLIVFKFLKEIEKLCE